MKVCLGMSGFVGYPLKGIDVEVTRAFKTDNTKSIKSSRIAQGEKEYLEASEEERRGVLERWYQLLAEEQLRKVQAKRKGKERAQAHEDS
jgi:hypothetical protein